MASRQEEKGMREDKMVGWLHWLHGHEFEQPPRVGDGQGSLACCSPWSCKESDTTEWLNWTESPLQTLSFSPSQWKTEYRTFTSLNVKKNVKVNVKALVAQLCPTLCNPMDCSPLGTMEFSRQEYWSGHFLLQGIFPIQGSNLSLLHLLHWQVDFITASPGKPLDTNHS